MAVTSRLRPIVVGVDGSTASAAAATAAARQARRELRSVRLILAVPDTAGPVPAAAITALDDLRMAMQPLMPALPVQAVVRRGPADRVLLEEAQRAAALVVGAGGRAGAELGPVARAVTERAACPVMVDRPVARDGAGVVVGVDGGPTTTDVLTAAAAQACARSISLLVIHCPRRPFADGSSCVGPSGAVGYRPLVEDVALLQQTLPGVPITLQVTDQDRVNCLLSAARTAELLVVGRHAPDGSNQAGSTGAVVTARAGAPVLVVPVPSGQPSLGREWARRHAVALAPSTVPTSAPSSGGPRPASAVTGSAARGAVRRLTLGSGPLKRMSDRIEMLSRLVLAVVLGLAAPVALAVATATATDLRATAQLQAATRNQVPALLLEDAASRPDAGTGTTAADSTTRTLGAWTAPNGTTREGKVPARFGSRAGDPVRIWIDQDGALTRAPLRDSDVTAATAVAGGGTIVLVIAAAGVAHGLVCWTLNRHRDRRWSADWATVEPTWSGRPR